MQVKVKESSVLEIIRNPNDLQINIFQREGRYGFTISRGPTRKMFKVLIEDLSMAKPKEEVIEYIRKIFEYAQALADDCNIATDLTAVKINKICYDLMELNSAKTHNC